eukprot:TRINITY_DN3883_c0_g1_i1.p1 TRINITY_DN3883_c0_g1~~TRINITY_DN3883_c0_g1_i1.p1  ORF type:complete len:406 (+),score=83.32 TRINITY_DN3883_c0_g1_i1:204-1421(+)
MAITTIGTDEAICRELLDNPFESFTSSKLPLKKEQPLKSRVGRRCSVDSDYSTDGVFAVPELTFLLDSLDQDLNDAPAPPTTNQTTLLPHDRSRSFTSIKTETQEVQMGMNIVETSTDDQSSSSPSSDPTTSEHPSSCPSRDEPLLEILWDGVLDDSAPLTVTANGCEEPTNSFADPVALDDPALLHWHLVRMSFDAMAHIDLLTGAVLCSNPAFQQLVCFVGGNDAALGLRTLWEQFLHRDMPKEAQRLFGTVELGSSSLDLWSVTQPADDNRVLWTIHQPTQNTLPLQSPQCSSEDAPNQVVAAPTTFPEAADCTDPRAKVWSSPEHRAVKGTRPSLFLWHKYGKKRRTGKSDTERVYYRCYQTDCKARLKIDTLLPSGESVHVHPSGEHNHVVRLVYDNVVG